MTSGTRAEPGSMETRISPLVSLLRCLDCGGPVEVTDLVPNADRSELGPDGRLVCTGCGAEYPIVAGTPRMVTGSPGDPEQELKRKTGATFGYEWRHFGGWRREWERNFADYMKPHDPEDLRGKLLLDVGTGSGRHAAEAARRGAQVVAVDIGDSIDVARENLPPEALTVQADAERLPFAPGAFDFVVSLGVLHHLPDPERALREIVRFARPRGVVHIYVYWVPPMRSHQEVLRVVSAVRRVTSRLPNRLLHALCYPLAGALYTAIVLPYRGLRGRPRGVGLAALLPLKAYADYPFGVLVNDQFDRFSAPVEHRYTESEVREMLARTGLTDITVLPNTGWVGDGRVPLAPHG